MKKIVNYSSGQALLLVLLSMSVVLVIVLSILARSTVDIGISSRSEESVRAFSAAEAGIEQALIAGPSGPFSGDVGDANFSGSVSAFSSGVTEFILPSNYYSGESATVWFVSHDEDGNFICDAASGLPCFYGDRMQICWGKDGTRSDTAFTPAIEVSVLYLSGSAFSTAEIVRDAIDPNASRRSSNSFTQTDGISCVIGGQNFPFSKIINFGNTGLGISPASIFRNAGGLQLARISFLYNTDIGHPVGVNVDYDSSIPLPSQGFLINSSGFSGNSTRRIEVVRGFAELPVVFENAVFSQDGASK